MDANLKSLLYEYQLNVGEIAFCMTVNEKIVMSWILDRRQPNEYQAEKLFHLLDFFREKYPDN